MGRVIKLYYNSLYLIGKANFYFVVASLFFLLGEIHCLWAKDYTEVDWFLLIDYKIYKQWAIRDLTIMGQMVLLSGTIFWRLDKRSPAKKITLAVFLYCLGDGFFFFLDYKTSNYGIIYIILCLCVIFNNNIKDLFRRK